MPLTSRAKIFTQPTAALLTSLLVIGRAVGALDQPNFQFRVTVAQVGRRGRSDARNDEDMMVSDAASIRLALRAALIHAMKQRDHGAISGYRSALAAIDNAEATPLAPSDRAGAIEMSVLGPGSTEVQRRSLTEQDMIDIVLREADDLRRAAQLLTDSRPDTSQRLRHEADLLQTLVDDAVASRRDDA